MAYSDVKADEQSGKKVQQFIKDFEQYYLLGNLAKARLGIFIRFAATARY